MDEGDIIWCSNRDSFLWLCAHCGKYPLQEDLGVGSISNPWLLLLPAVESFDEILYDWLVHYGGNIFRVWIRDWKISSVLGKGKRKAGST